MDDEVEIMDDKTRRRRILLLSSNFIKNLAYYRAGRSNNTTNNFKADSSDACFWVQVNNNFIDMCVLDWCKIFGDEKSKHFYEKAIREQDKEAFKEEFYENLGGKDKFEKYIKSMRIYRDKFVAHLDEDNKMNIPDLYKAKKSIKFLYGYIIDLDEKKSYLQDLPYTVEILECGYDQCFQEAQEIYRYASQRQQQESTL